MIETRRVLSEGRAETSETLLLLTDTALSVRPPPNTRTVLPSVLIAQAKLCQVCTVWPARGFATHAQLKTEGNRSVQFVI